MNILRHAALIGLISLPVWGSDEIPSGPEAGAALEPLKVVAAVGERLGETVNAVEERAGKPTLYLFVRADQWDRPMGRLIKTLDEALAANPDAVPEAALVAVWITDDPGKSREYLPRAQQSIQLKKTRWAVFDGPATGPEGWSLNDAAGLTAVVARDGKVVRSTGFTSWNETDARKLLRTLRGD